MLHCDVQGVVGDRDGQLVPASQLGGQLAEAALVGDLGGDSRAVDRDIRMYGVGDTPQEALFQSVGGGEGQGMGLGASLLFAASVGQGQIGEAQLGGGPCLGKAGGRR